MANITEIQNQESGLSVRTKLNAAIAEANKVEGKADSGGLALVATSGAYGDLIDPPLLGTMAGEDTTDYTPTAGLGTAAFTDSTAYATAAQGGLADTAVQLGDATAVPHVVVTTSKTLALTDANTEQQVEAAATITIPTNATVAFERGDKIAALSLTAGTVTLAASSGVTLNGIDGGSADITTQYLGAVVTKVGIDAWVINGDTSEVA